MNPLPTGRALLDAREILTTAGLRPGQVYADFGAGAIGHFVFPASIMVGTNGRVYAIDILKSALGAIAGRAAAERATNVTTVWGDLEHEKGTMALPPHAVDLVSLVNLTGILKRSPNVMKNIVRALKGGGRLLLVDWKRAPSPLGPPLEGRSSPEEFKAMCTAAGFALIGEFDAGPFHWGLLFQKESGSV